MSKTAAKRALRAFGQRLAATADAEDAMRAALAAAAEPEGVVQQTVTYLGVHLNVGHDGDPEEGWSITVDTGTDISALIDQTALFHAVADLVDADLKAIHQRELEDAREEVYFIGCAR